MTCCGALFLKPAAVLHLLGAATSQRHGGAHITSCSVDYRSAAPLIERGSATFPSKVRRVPGALFSTTAGEAVVGAISSGLRTISAAARLQAERSSTTRGGGGKLGGRARLSKGGERPDLPRDVVSVLSRLAAELRNRVQSRALRRGWGTLG